LTPLYPFVPNFTPIYPFWKGAREALLTGFGIGRKGVLITTKAIKMIAECLEGDNGEPSYAIDDTFRKLSPLWAIKKSPL